MFLWDARPRERKKTLATDGMDTHPPNTPSQHLKKKSFQQVSKSLWPPKRSASHLVCQASCVFTGSPATIPDASVRETLHAPSLPRSLHLHLGAIFRKFLRADSGTGTKFWFGFVVPDSGSTVTLSLIRAPSEFTL